MQMLSRKRNDMLARFPEILAVPRDAARHGDRWELVVLEDQSRKASPPPAMVLRRAAHGDRGRAARDVTVAKTATRHRLK
jgi:hypothetical protein